jgi:hypothetical protein
VLLDQREMDLATVALLDEMDLATVALLDGNTVTLLGRENTLYEVGAGVTAGPERGGWG